MNAIFTLRKERNQNSTEPGETKMLPPTRKAAGGAALSGRNRLKSWQFGGGGGGGGRPGRGWAKAFIYLNFSLLSRPLTELCCCSVSIRREYFSLFSAQLNLLPIVCCVVGGPGCFSRLINLHIVLCVWVGGFPLFSVWVFFCVHCISFHFGSFLPA